MPTKGLWVTQYNLLLSHRLGCKGRGGEGQDSLGVAQLAGTCILSRLVGAL